MAFRRSTPEPQPRPVKPVDKVDLANSRAHSALAAFAYTADELEAAARLLQEAEAESAAVIEEHTLRRAQAQADAATHHQVAGKIRALIA